MNEFAYKLGKMAADEITDVPSSGVDSRDVRGPLNFLGNAIGGAVNWMGDKVNSINPFASKVRSSPAFASTGASIADLAGAAAGDAAAAKPKPTPTPAPDYRPFELEPGYAPPTPTPTPTPITSTPASAPNSATYPTSRTNRRSIPSRPTTVKPPLTRRSIPTVGNPLRTTPYRKQPGQQGRIGTPATAPPPMPDKMGFARYLGEITASR